MKYHNAADVLPKELLVEILNYVSGELLYIPSSGEKRDWGEKSGSRQYYQERNKEMKRQYKNGKAMEDIAKEFCLSYDSVRKIVKE